MKEIDIIDYLKLNRLNGIAFVYMPPEAREWCINNHSNYHIPFRKLTDDGGSAKWVTLPNIENFEYSKVYCLEEDYDYQPEFKGYWEEFDIDEYGKFMITSKDKDCVASLYPWWNWTGFLSDNDNKYNAFGGWFFKSEENSIYLWSTVPQMMFKGDLFSFLRETRANDKSCSPAIPAKIRFWRYRE